MGRVTRVDREGQAGMTGVMQKREKPLEPLHLGFAKTGNGLRLG